MGKGKGNIDDDNCCKLWCVFALGLTMFLVSAIFAFPVYFAGYEVRNERNDRLVKTTCTITNGSIWEKICYRNCNCWNDCRTRCDSSSSYDSGYYRKRSCRTTCTRRCSRCPYTCFGWKRDAMYLTHDKKEYYYVEATGTRDLRQDSQSLADQRGSWMCYYDPEDMNLVLKSKYDVKAWLGWAISSFVFMGIGLLILIWVGLTYAYCFYGSEHSSGGNGGSSYGGSSYNYNGGSYNYNGGSRSRKTSYRSRKTSMDWRNNRNNNLENVYSPWS